MEIKEDLEQDMTIKQNLEQELKFHKEAIERAEAQLKRLEEKPWSPKCEGNYRLNSSGQSVTLLSVTIVKNSALKALENKWKIFVIL